MIAATYRSRLILDRANEKLIVVWGFLIPMGKKTLPLDAYQSAILEAEEIKGTRSRPAHTIYFVKLVGSREPFSIIGFREAKEAAQLADRINQYLQSDRGK